MRDMLLLLDDFFKTGRKTMKTGILGESSQNCESSCKTGRVDKSDFGNLKCLRYYKSIILSMFFKM